MTTPSSSSDKTTAKTDTAFAAWGGFIGTVTGLVIGLLTTHWLTWALIIGIAGYIIGAIIDRSRR
jgi:hypothetical protein